MRQREVLRQSTIDTVNELFPGEQQRRKVTDSDSEFSTRLNKTADMVSEAMATHPPFPDTIAAMNRLSKHYKLIALSNCDRDLFSSLCAGPLKGMTWDAIYLAEDIGAYKPDKKNFEYLFEHAKADFGAEFGWKDEDDVKDGLIMVAQGLGSDHRPIGKGGYGVHSVWIDRQDQLGKAKGKGIEEEQHRQEWGYRVRLETLGQLADIVDQAFAA